MKGTQNVTDEEWPEFLNANEVARILRVSKMTVYREIHSGVLESVRVGRSFRIPADSVRQYLKHCSSTWRKLPLAAHLTIPAESLDAPRGQPTNQPTTNRR
jgi:excisionase family DNA binding protein